MQEPLSLYVDELTPDKIKATVSTTNSLIHNLSVLKKLVPDLTPAYIGEKINGVSVMPIGRFICMLTGPSGNRGMILLDLIDKEELAEAMADKLGHPDLRDRFMEVYDYILSHPEHHENCELVVGKAKGLFR